MSFLLFLYQNRQPHQCIKYDSDHQSSGYNILPKCAFICRQIGEQTGYAIVCDGMGGENAGDVASATACRLIEKFFHRDIREGMSEGSAKAVIFSAISAANAKVYSMAKENPAYHGMGTTLVLAVVVGEQMHIVNIGDSRIYMVEKRAVKQLTRDHTLVQNMIDRGELSVEEAEHHPKKHYITRAIGVGDTLDIDYQMYELKKESVVLLCTDGLSNYLKLEKLPELLKSCIRKGSLQELIDYANNRGGSDNITAVVLYRQ